MIVTGYSLSGLAARPLAPAGATPPADTQKPRETAHFSQISAISPGSLAAAYQAIRAQEAAIAPPVPAGDPAILSALGIPAAFAAYGEFDAAD